MPLSTPTNSSLDSSIMSSSKLNICLVPMKIEWGDKQTNLEALEKLLPDVHPATDLVILPELFSTGFITSMPKDELWKYAERNTGATIDRIKLLSDKYGVAIAGSFIADSGGLLFNRAFFIEPSGEECFADKRHLFSMARENDSFNPGNSRLSVRYRGWNIAMVVCYDIRFPVWCRNRDNEYDLLIAVANWPAVRIDAWNKLLQARAIENLSYVAGVNCMGTDNNGFEYDGSSHILDFKGNGIAYVDSDKGFLYASLSKEKLDKFRSKFPAHNDADLFEILDK